MDVQQLSGLHILILRDLTDELVEDSVPWSHEMAAAIEHLRTNGMVKHVMKGGVLRYEVTGEGTKMLKSWESMLKGAPTS